MVLLVTVVGWVWKGGKRAVWTGLQRPQLAVVLLVGFIGEISNSKVVVDSWSVLGVAAGSYKENWSWTDLARRLQSKSWECRKYTNGCVGIASAVVNGATGQPKLSSILNFQLIQVTQGHFCEQTPTKITLHATNRSSVSTFQGAKPINEARLRHSSLLIQGTDPSGSSGQTANPFGDLQVINTIETRLRLSPSSIDGPVICGYP
jgi:hypothetical protein